MSRNKEQCINIINQQFNRLINEKDEKLLFIALEKSIIDISSSEFALVWLMDSKGKSVKTFHENRAIELKLEKSILKTVSASKRGFFDNYVVSHPKYNSKIDNILKIKIKSMIVVPILDKTDNRVVAFVSAFNSVKHKGEFKRYDIRLLSLLNRSVFETIKVLEMGGESNVPIEEIKIEKKSVEVFHNTIPISVKNQEETKKLGKTKVELEAELELQKRRLELLEEELLLKTEALENREKEIKEYALTVINEEEAIPLIDNHSDIYTILNFLGNEVNYLANEEHKIYLFLEIIKNSLHNKEQLKFLNSELEKIQLIENLANALYSREKMPILLESFALYQVVNDITVLYSRTLSDKNITFNIFLDPQIPNTIIADKDKIKSLIIHSLNNIFNFTINVGTIELGLSFSDETGLLTITLKSLQEYKPKKIKNFFNHQEVNHTLTSSKSGIGLSVSSNLVKILGGKLKLSTVGEEGQMFTILLPVKRESKRQKIEFDHRIVMKIAILMSEENSHAVDNLIHYLIVMGVDEKFIFTVTNLNQVDNITISHLFCFENLFSSKLKLKNFPSVTILKYSQKNLKQQNRVNTLYVNSYYGLKLQKILFPHMKTVDFEEKTLLIEDSFLTKFSNVVKKLKFS